MLSFIPDSVLYAFVNTIFIAGVIGSLLGFLFNFNFLAPYRPIVQLIGLLLLGAGLYFKGGYEVEVQWREKAAKFQEKVNEAEQKSIATNSDIQTQIVTKTKVIHDTKIVTKEVLKEKEVAIDRDCSVPDIITVLNKAAVRPVLDLSLPQLDVEDKK